MKYEGTFLVYRVYPICPGSAKGDAIQHNKCPSFGTTLPDQDEWCRAFLLLLSSTMRTMFDFYYLSAVTRLSIYYHFHTLSVTRGRGFVGKKAASREGHLFSFVQPGLMMPPKTKFCRAKESRRDSIRNVDGHNKSKFREQFKSMPTFYCRRPRCSSSDECRR